MNAFEFIDTLWCLCADNEELRHLLEIKDDDDYSLKIRQEDVLAEGYDADKLPFVAMYFNEAWTTYNDYANLGYLYIDIYAPMRETVPAIRKIIVDIMHNHFNERVRNEGQEQSGVHAVYKYRLQFTPLIST